MIPTFDSDGYLPKGEHLAKMEEFITSFAYNETRKELLGHLKRFIIDIKSVGCRVIYIDGSYVTAKEEPDDIDLCWEDKGVNYDVAEMKMPILADTDKMKLEYNMHIYPARFTVEGSDQIFLHFFQQIKHTKIPKGIIKILI